ncbi:mitochondrial biogenesis AIM24-domain-containing protein [Lipomyces arxii]|uniref:mitochondrial biogenesis AIM24-domain-containing protein n=1 Tax=Lipomyces arxii TaxID=56418 RepID=UPI0034CF6E10
MFAFNWCQSRRCLIGTSKMRPSRSVHIAQSPTASIPLSMDVSDLVKSVPEISGDGPFPKTPKFEVLGSSASLLNIALPASATLFTRRGTLVGINGQLENATSTLSILSPTVRALVGIPFMYQKLTSTTPLTALVSSKSRSVHTTFAVVSLDGRVDWVIAQRNGLLAWAGSTLTVKPKLMPNLSLSRWGNTTLSGRGEVALVGKGQIYQLTLQDEGEEFAVHPANVLAYASNLPASAPLPYRIRHLKFRLQVPDVLKRLIPTVTSTTPTTQFLSRSWFNIKTTFTRFVYGNDMLLKFKGPTTILIQSRASRLSDLIPASEMMELARLEPVPAMPAVAVPEAEAKIENVREGNASNGGHLKIASVKQGKVVFKSVDSFKEFVV